MLSILIPAYNYNVLPLVKELALQAQQAAIEYEVIVLDDCSTIYLDENQSIADLPNCRFLKNNANLGRTATRHKLAETAIYDMLLFLDADIIPVSSDFLVKYKSYILDKAPVVIGGIAYKQKNEQPDTELRHKYGIHREQKYADDRNKNPYGSVLSGNLLIFKEVFITNNYNHAENYYGMDILFAYNLYKNNISIYHIDNPVYHLGLESNEHFFKKSLEAVRNRKLLLADAEGIEEVNPMLGYYKKLKKWHIHYLVIILFKLTRGPLKRRVVREDPDLFCFDLYRLGYICAVK